MHLRAAVFIDIDLVAPRNSRLILLSKRSPGRALLETRNPERLIHIPCQRSLVERKLR